MSRRRLRRAMARLLLLVPAVPLTGCGPPWGCKGGASEVQAAVTSGLPLPDGGVTDENSSCEDACVALGLDPASPCVLTPGSAGSPPTASCVRYSYCEGRRPEGLALPQEGTGRDCALGALFSRLAHLEAASVPAFTRLADELAEFGAPVGLVRRARRSAADEVRHAESVGALARAHGAMVPAVEVREMGRRTLEEVAFENAVEGCVRETYGALVAAWRASCAADADVRTTYARIAPEERRHAELAWDIDAWATRQLSAEALARVRGAQRAALEQLVAEVTAEAPDAGVVREAGLPTGEPVRELVMGLAAELFGVNALQA